MPNHRLTQHLDDLRQERDALHITRNPYGHSQDEVREARLRVCRLLESYKDAYQNMKRFAEQSGLDTTAYPE